MKPLLLILALAVSVSPQAKRLGISSEYDRFTDTTIIKNRQSIMPVRPGTVMFNLVASVRGRHERGMLPHEVAIVIESRSDEWVFLGQTNTFRVLYNETERYSLGTMRRLSSEIERYGVTETLYLEVTLDQIEKLVNADKLEIQIGPLESEIKPEQRASFKEWLALFRKPKPSASPLSQLIFPDLVTEPQPLMFVPALRHHGRQSLSRTANQFQ